MQKAVVSEMGKALARRKMKARRTDDPCFPAARASAKVRSGARRLSQTLTDSRLKAQLAAAADRHDGNCDETKS